jgi:hypothetical protein
MVFNQEFLKRSYLENKFQEVLALASNETYTFLVDFLVNASDERQFLINYITHCTNPGNLDKAPHNVKARTGYET